MWDRFLILQEYCEGLTPLLSKIEDLSYPKGRSLTTVLENAVDEYLVLKDKSQFKFNLDDNT